jgi:hypothetical protein
LSADASKAAIDRVRPTAAASPSPSASVVSAASIASAIATWADSASRTTGMNFSASSTMVTRPGGKVPMP